MQPSDIRLAGEETPEALRAARDAAIQAAQVAMRDSTRLMRLLAILGEPIRLGELLDRALATLSELFSAEVVVLLDPAGNGHFRPAAAVGLPEDAISQAFVADEESPVAQVLRDSRVLAVEASDGVAIDAQLLEQGVQSSIWIPVKGSRSTRGVLILGRCRPQKFLQTDIGLLSAMGYRLGIALEQAQRRQQMETLVASGVQIGCYLDLASVAAEAVAIFPSVVGADAAVLWLAQAGNNHLAREGVPATLDEVWHRLATSCLDECTQPGWFLSTNDLDVELAQRGISTLGELPVRSMLALTISHQDRPLGILFALRFAAIGFLPDTYQLAMLFAGQTASALENARLCQTLRDELRERLQLEEALRSAKQQVESLLDQRTMQLDAVHLELVAQKREYEGLYNTAPCGYHTLDAQAAFLRVNQTEQEMLGYSESELLGGMRLTDVLVPEDLPAFEASWRHLFEEGFTRDRQLHFRRKNGSVFPVVVNAIVIRGIDGRGDTTRCIIFDDTERVARDLHIAQLNIELQQRAVAAEAASRAKSAFLATMSHEVRTPLHAIQGFTELLKRRGAQPEQRVKLDRISDASRQLLDILNDVLEVARADTTTVLALDPACFDLSALLNSVLLPFSQKATEKGLVFESHLCDLPVSVQGDATRLGEILRKLLSNALKFTARGSICLRGRVISRTQTALTLRFEVEDTGIGIPPEDGERIFRPFEQGDNTSTRSYGGTGLGLSIVRRLAALMGGEVGFSSIVGVGSIFWLTVQLQPAPAALEQARARVDGDVALLIRERFSGTRVLIAEDNPINREVIAALLEDVGLRAVMAEDGLQACKMAQMNECALILMDMKMPNMDGLQATRGIRSQAQNANVPILALTANASSEDRLLCQQAGMNEFLVKPLDPQQLYESMYHWLTRTRHTETLS